MPLLARFPKRIYTEKETFSPRMEIYQFGEKDLKPGKMNWKLTDESGHVIAQGKLAHATLKTSQVDSLGEVNVPLSAIQKAGKYTFQAEIAGHIRKGNIHFRQR